MNVRYRVVPDPEKGSEAVRIEGWELDYLAVQANPEIQNKPKEEWPRAWFSIRWFSSLEIALAFSQEIADDEAAKAERHKAVAVAWRGLQIEVPGKDPRVPPAGHVFRMVAQARSSSHCPNREYLHWQHSAGFETNTWDELHLLLPDDRKRVARVLGVSEVGKGLKHSERLDHVSLVAARMDDRAVSEGRGVGELFEQFLNEEIRCCV